MMDLEARSQDLRKTTNRGPEGTALRCTVESPATGEGWVGTGGKMDVHAKLIFYPAFFCIILVNNNKANNLYCLSIPPPSPPLTVSQFACHGSNRARKRSTWYRFRTILGNTVSRRIFFSINNSIKALSR